MNGLLGAMFNLQQCEISIYQPAQQQTAGDRKGEETRRRIYVFAALSLLPHGLNINCKLGSTGTLA